MLPGIVASDVRLGALQTHAAASGTTIVVAYPAGVRGDDVIYLGVWALSAAVITSLGGAWSDWIRVSGTGSTLIPSFYVATRLATQGLTGTVTVTIPNVDAQARMVAVPGVDLSSILDHTASAQFKDQTTAQSTAVVATTTLTRPNGFSVGAWICNAAAKTCTPPSGWTDQTNGSGTVPMDLCTKQFTAAGATGTITFTTADAGSVKALAQVLHFKPRTLNPVLLAA